MASVEFRSVTKRWGAFVGVRDLDLSVDDKEFLVLLGPSGCGKTTTMRMIAGLEEPTDGEIWIGDELVNEMPPRERDVAMVFQNYGLYPHMTVRDNIGYPLKVRGVPKDEAAAPGRGRGGEGRARPLPRPQARPALGRPAPARGARALARAHAARLPDGRAALEPRRQAARHHAGRAEAPPPRAARSPRSTSPTTRWRR